MCSGHKAWAGIKASLAYSSEVSHLVLWHMPVLTAPWCCTFHQLGVYTEGSPDFLIGNRCLVMLSISVAGRRAPQRSFPLIPRTETISVTGETQRGPLNPFNLSSLSQHATLCQPQLIFIYLFVCLCFLGILCFLLALEITTLILIIVANIYGVLPHARISFNPHNNTVLRRMGSLLIRF